jgi:hypothetical protein
VRNKRLGTPVETKYIDKSISQNMDTNGTITLLNGCATGTTISTRIGRQVVVSSIEFSVTVGPTVTTGTDQIDRLLIVYDRQADGAAPIITDVLAASDSMSLFNPDNSKRFAIIYDKVFAVSGYADSSSAVVTGHIVRRMNKLIQYNSGNAGTVADINSGAMYLISLGSAAPGATAGYVAGRLRVNFNDL